MTENQRYLREAQAHAREFEDKQEPESLRQSYETLENVQWREELDPEDRSEIRHKSLRLWLHLIALVDDRLDPDFDPEDVPQSSVQPPPTRAGVVYPPGVEPSRIDDPVRRAEYEQEIADNDAKIAHYNLQTRLGRLDERITQRAEDFIKGSYSDSPDDDNELATAIGETIQNPQRKAALLEFLNAE